MNSHINNYAISVGRLRFIASGIIFKITLDLSYVTYLTNAFANHFLTPFTVDFSMLQYMESFLWIVLVFSFVPFTSRSAGGLAFFSASVFLFVPMVTMYGLDAERSRYAIFLTTLAIGAAYLVSAATFGSSARIPIPINGRQILATLSFAVAGIFLLASALSGALFNMNFNITRVYEFRNEMAQLVDSGFLAYTNLWSQKVFTPLILAIGLYRRSYWMIAFALAMHLIYFGVTQHRSHLFTPALVFIAFLLYRKEFSYTTGFFALAIVIAVLNAAILFFDLNAFGALTIRRALFVGASVTYSWIDYFSVHPKVFFSDNLLASIVRNEYTGINIPKFMGDYMRADMSIAFNSGLVGAGFAQLDVFGVVLYGAIIGVFIRLNKKIIQAGVPPYIPAAILFLPYRIAWADSDLLTALLSHGIIVGTFAAWLFGATRTDVRSDSASHKETMVEAKEIS